MKQQNGVKDQDSGATLRALRRAARRARELGARTGTPVYVIQQQRIVDLTKQNMAVQRDSVKTRHTRRSS